MTLTKKFIDVEDVLRNKNPELTKMLPRFVLKYIRSIIHETEINEFIEIHGQKKDFDFGKQILERFNIKNEAINFIICPS